MKQMSPTMVATSNVVFVDLPLVWTMLKAMTTKQNQAVI